MTDLSEAKRLVEAANATDAEVYDLSRLASWSRDNLPTLIVEHEAALARVRELEEGLRPFAASVRGEGLDERINLAEPANKDWRHARALLGEEGR